MQRAAHRPGTDDFAVGDGLLDTCVGSVLNAESNRPKGAEVVLSLDSAQPVHDITWLLKQVLGDELIMKTPMCNVQTCPCYSECVTTLWAVHNCRSALVRSYNRFAVSE